MSQSRDYRVGLNSTAIYWVKEKRMNEQSKAYNDILHFTNSKEVFWLDYNELRNNWNATTCMMNSKCFKMEKEKRLGKKKFLLLVKG
jgi:hypothetical protein